MDAIPAVPRARLHRKTSTGGNQSLVGFPNYGLLSTVFVLCYLGRGIALEGEVSSQGRRSSAPQVKGLHRCITSCRIIR